MNSYALLATIFGGYLLGSIPFGLVLCKMAGLGDIRKIGSGNIGATNVLRTGRKDLAILTLICDSGKAALGAILAQHYLGNPAYALLAGSCGVLGHMFPVWLGFKGGKGVAAIIGVQLATAWQIGLAFGGTWLLVAFTFRISSLSALIALLATPIYAWFFISPLHAGFYAVLSIVSWIRHKDNIKRILKGEESKIKWRKKKPESEQSAQ